VTEHSVIPPSTKEIAAGDYVYNAQFKAVLRFAGLSE